MPPEAIVTHSQAFRTRRFLNWFPLGLSYAMLYMGRYNLTVAKTSLGDLMTKEDFGVIFGIGTVVYATSYFVTGPFVDCFGGRRGMLIGLTGACSANLAMGLYLHHVLGLPDAATAPLRTVFSVLYATNMFFQTFGAASIVKVNSNWFHVRERGGFSGIFGTMISSGIFLAFSVNFWLLDVGKQMFPGVKSTWVVFFTPAALLAIMLVIEVFLLRNKPSEAGHEDFDTADASSGDDDVPLPTLQVFKRLFTNPILLTVGGIELCTGILRQGVMQWFPIYAKEVWVLPHSHPLINGDWHFSTLALAVALGVVLNAVIARVAGGNIRRALISAVTLAALSPFFLAGWGGLLFVAGVIGGNVGGWVSDLFFQSRRAPAAFGLYVLLTVCVIAMAFALAPATNVVSWAKDGTGLQAGDRILAIDDKPIEGWAAVGPAVACIEPTCVDSTWNPKTCVCSTQAAARTAAPHQGPLTLKIDRHGQSLEVAVPDPAATQRAGDKRVLGARPELPMSPWVLGVIVFFISLAVIGVHGLLSGTATMDFGGRKAAATAVGMIDGAVYLGTAIQAFALGYITTHSWAAWPWFLLPFGVVGTFLLTRIWNAKPKGAAH